MQYYSVNFHSKCIKKQGTSYSNVWLYTRKCSTEIKKGKRKYYTNQKANSAANLFAIHFSHFHAVPETESNVSQKGMMFILLQWSTEKGYIWLSKLTEMMPFKGIWVSSWPRCVRDFVPPFLGHGIPQSSRKPMFFSGSVIDLLGDCWRSFGFFTPCVQVMPAEASVAARTGSPAPLLLSGTHSQSCLLPVQTSRRDSRLGSIFCWVSFSPRQSDHQSAAQTLVLAQGRGWCEWGNAQGWVCFLQR